MEGLRMEETIFDACRKAAFGVQTASGIAEGIIQAIIDRTPSPRCAEELTRILREGGVEVQEATFD